MQEEHDALATRQDKVVSAPVRALPQTKVELTLDAYVYDKGFGCVLRPELWSVTKNPLSICREHWTLYNKTIVQHM